MLIDFSPVDRHEVQLLEFAKQLFAGGFESRHQCFDRFYFGHHQGHERRANDVFAA